MPKVIVTFDPIPVKPPRYRVETLLKHVVAEDQAQVEHAEIWSLDSVFNEGQVNQACAYALELSNIKQTTVQVVDTWEEGEN